MSDLGFRLFGQLDTYGLKDPFLGWPKKATCTGLLATINAAPHSCLLLPEKGQKYGSVMLFDVCLFESTHLEKNE